MMPLWILVIFATASSADKKNLKFFIYDFPGESLGWVGEDGKWLRSSVFFGGYGQPIDETRGLYRTNQYSLYKIMLRRALVDPRRTLNPVEASAFLIPYDMGYDAAVRQDKGLFLHHCSTSEVIETRLNQSSFFTRNKGKDHILIFSVNFGMNRFIKGNMLFGGRFESKYPYKKLLDEKGINWRAVPFPSDLHWNTKMSKPYPWESDHERPFLVGYGGSIESFSHPAAHIRQLIATQCDARPDICRRMSYGKGRSSTLSSTNGTSIHDIFNTSVFCLNPPGDLPTRKGLFDSMLMGCIPVTFNPLSATAMYTWHWPEEYWKRVAVEIDDRLFKTAGFNIVTFLEQLSQNKSEISIRQNLLRDRAYQLQYSYTEPMLHTRPGPDAFDIAMDEAMRFGAGLSDGVRNASVPPCGFHCNTVHR